MKDGEITRVTVRIMGEEYVLRSDASAEHVRLVAQIVNDKMEEIAKAQPQLDLPRVAIMTALSLADQLLRQQKSDDDVELKGDRRNQTRHGRGTSGKL